VDGNVSVEALRSLFHNFLNSNMVHEQILMWIAGVVITILISAIGTAVAFVLNGISDTLKSIQTEIKQLTETQNLTIREFDGKLSEYSIRLNDFAVRHELCKHCNE
jgi:hypothetical protein